MDDHPCATMVSIRYLSFLSVLNVKTSSESSSTLHDSPETDSHLPSSMQVDRFGQAICEAFIANRRLTDLDLFVGDRVTKWLRKLNIILKELYAQYCKICKICIYTIY